MMGTIPETPQPGDRLPDMLRALPINPRNLDKLDAIRREIEAVRKDRDDWRKNNDLYRSSWLRNLGGTIFRKRHEIDGLAMTTEHQRIGYERARAAGLIGTGYYRDEENGKSLCLFIGGPHDGSKEDVGDGVTEFHGYKRHRILTYVFVFGASTSDVEGKPQDLCAQAGADPLVTKDVE